MGTSPSTKSDLVRSLYATFIAGDRPRMETLLAGNFTFTSPYDDHIDKAEYFIRCWPNREKLRNLEIETLFVDADAAFVRYRATRTNDGVTFRNVEYVVCAGKQIKSVEVYFGAEEKSS
jgi:ketosteroid isomerase-like protein